MPERETDKLEIDVAVEYLMRYVGATREECNTVLNKLWGRIKTQYSEQLAVDRMKEIISFCVLYTSHVKGRLPQDKPINILFYCQKYDELTERKWWPLFKKLIEEDKSIENVRAHCLAMGVIHPVEYSPNTRQAFNWLQTYANKDNDPGMKKRLRSLVYAYGGNVICGVFDKDKEMSRLRSQPEDNRDYFFERLIYTVYSADQIVKIKRLELDKTSPKLVVSLKK